MRVVSINTGDDDDDVDESTWLPGDVLEKRCDAVQCDATGFYAIRFDVM